MNDRQVFGAYLKEKRNERVITLRALAGMIGVGYGYYSDLESGRRTPIDLDFLDNVTGVEGGAYYGYLDDTLTEDSSPALTAIGLLCQMYMGWKADHPALVKGTDYLAEIGPMADNLYYSYYATQVMHHVGGEKWEKWNKKMRDDLVERQAQKGHERGSWPIEGGLTGESGGRLMTTALAAMILEVYYRHLPLYRQTSTLEAFPLE